MKPKQFFSFPHVTTSPVPVAAAALLALALVLLASPTAAAGATRTTQASTATRTNATGRAGNIELRTLQLATEGDDTQLRAELSATAHWNLFTLANPLRAVIDLRHTRAAGRFVAPQATGLVSRVRSGPQADGSLRLVLDLTEPARVRAQLLPSGAGRGPTLQITVSLTAAPARTATVLAAATPARSSTPPALEPQEAPPSSRPATTSVPVRAAHAPTDSGRPIIVAVDAGHGGADPGASGRGGTREKDVVLGIAKALAARINSEPGMRAVLTRDGDYVLTLRQRIAKARAAKADMFVSVHADSVRNPVVSGASVYVLSEKGATNEQARWLAERENAADLKGGVSLDDKSASLATVLLDLSQTASLSASLQAADRVLTSLDRVGQVRKAQVQQAGFVVLKSPDIPSMLVETAYISNPDDERRLRRPEHQQLLAQAIFSGVHAYFERNPPDGTQPARNTARSSENGGGGSQTLARSAP